MSGYSDFGVNFNKCCNEYLVCAKTMDYLVIADEYEKIEATTKRLEMTDLLVGLLKNTPTEVISKVVYLTQGKL